MTKKVSKSDLLEYFSGKIKDVPLFLRECHSWGEHWYHTVQIIVTKFEGTVILSKLKTQI